jgi:hypothetical protein
MYWWEFSMVQPLLGIPIAVLAAIILVALTFSFIYAIFITLIHDFSWCAFKNGAWMGFVSGLKFQWDIAVIIFALIITVGTISSFTSK